jgi:hypothetical protein
MNDEFINRTCGSVRRSPSASARLVTAESKAAETTTLRRQRRGEGREAFAATASVNVVGELDGMICPTQVNCRRHRYRHRAKDADRLQPKGKQPDAPRWSSERTDNVAAGVEAGANSSRSSLSNIVNPTFRLPSKAGGSARNAEGTAGRGCWRKPRPLCNGADRSHHAPPRKRADFQRVVRDEKAGRTFAGGNRK